MPTLKQQIDAKFLAKLSESNAVDDVMIEQLRVQLDAPKKPKVDDLVRLFSNPRDGEVK